MMTIFMHFKAMEQLIINAVGIGDDEIISLMNSTWLAKM